MSLSVCLLLYHGPCRYVCHEHFAVCDYMKQLSVVRGFDCVVDRVVWCVGEGVVEAVAGQREFPQ
jgi:hypothetical protein